MGGKALQSHFPGTIGQSKPGFGSQWIGLMQQTVAIIQSVITLQSNQAAQ